MNKIFFCSITSYNINTNVVGYFMKHFTILIIIFNLLISCKHEHKVTLNQVRIDTSISKYGFDILEALPIITHELNLPPINKGVDSFEFRFWLPQKSLDTINILTIKCTANTWKSNLTTFLAVLPDREYRQGDTTNYFRHSTIKFANTSTITPDIDINLIIDTLANYDLQNSPLNSEIETGQVSSSGDIRFILEFADKHNYRALHYFRSSRNEGATAFDKTFEQFLSFIKRHYKIDIP